MGTPGSPKNGLPLPPTFHLLGQTFSSLFGRAGFTLESWLRHLFLVVVPMFTRPHVSGEGARARTQVYRYFMVVESGRLTSSRDTVDRCHRHECCGNLKVHLGGPQRLGCIRETSTAFGGFGGDALSKVYKTCDFSLISPGRPKPPASLHLIAPCPGALVHIQNA